MAFLPENYKDPTKSGDYVKLYDGANKLRILSDPLFGWEYWIEEDGKKKPIRKKMLSEIPVDKRKEARYFWVMVVWNYMDEKTQIFEITQSTIRKTLESLATDASWGDPKEYDLSITRSGEGLDTAYTVLPTKPTPFKKDGKFIPEIDLEKLFTGEDPFFIEHEIDLDEIAKAI